MLEPELLLLDEPFSALDPPTRSRILDDLKHLLAEVQTTTVFVTHDLPEAKLLAERMAVIIGNRITSYNVCYTKLLRRLFQQRTEVVQDARAGGWIKRRERLVQQEQFGFQHQRTREADALRFAAG